MNAINWSDLLRISPAMERYERDAKSCGIHARWDWYPRWIPRCRWLVADCQRIAQQSRLDFYAVRDTAVAFLLGVYEAERARQQRRGKAERATR